MAEPKRLTIEDVRPLRREVFTEEWPGAREVNLLLLRCSDVQAAHFAAVEHFQNSGQPMDSVSYPEFVREKELQEVYRMLLQPDCKEPKCRLFKTAKDAREALSLDEIAWWLDRHQRRIDETLIERKFTSAAALAAAQEADGD